MLQAMTNAGLRIALVVAAAVALLFSRVLMFPTNALLFLILVALLWRPVGHGGQQAPLAEARPASHPSSGPSTS